MHQQQPFLVFLVSTGLREVPGFGLVVVFAAGLPWTLDFISVERVVNAFSTFTASLAEVSKNLMPRESASALPSSVLICLLASRSFLLPTSNLTTFSLPYLLTSASQFSTSLKDCRSVIS